MRFQSVAVLVLVLAGCGDDAAKRAAYESCTADDQCQAGLVCDTHGNASGFCLEPHGHGGAGMGGAGMGGAGMGGAGMGGVGMGGAGMGGAGMGGAGMGGAGMGGMGAVVPTCEAYCDCMVANCAMRTAYPFADRAACMTACTGHSDPQRTCWTRMCSEVPASAENLKLHLCQHAWGAFALDEC